MATLKEQLLVPDVRPGLVKDCCTCIDEEVASKRGLKAVALKGAYKTVKAIRRGFVEGAVDALLDEFVIELEPYYADFRSSGASSLSAHLEKNRPTVAESLLKVTDARARKSKHKTAVKMYERLRSSAKQHVESALPRLGEVIQRHLKA